ncbi:protein-disulfide isomerase-like protein [Caballeronia terrestris]|jgi:thiol:disulfide interchange protein DsbC|uniref:Thiol:disulfide interchange protein n=2 Tax=Caballeronia TaxID=1827195 RepID=A0A158KI93_9BURK|nr:MULTISPECIES: DsbC family protein [Caballeronia]SAL59361.1 protein-disulfide isomerase-like protein [Caballeronia humi]SAL80499.1 protein-disulfide isomerase-like protein [Caballeronia terrestris]
MKNTLRSAVVAAAMLGAIFGIGCSAQADQTTDKLKSTLQSRMGDATIKSVEKSPIPGLYEINLGTQIVYSDATGNYVLLGDLVDTRTRSNLTEARLAETNKIDFAKLPFENAVKVVKGNGSRKIAVFSDPNCPYCKQLETTLKSVDNVTVYTFLYPVLSPDSTTKSKSIWCAKDRAMAWEGWMLDHKTPALASCDTTAIDKNMQLGKSMNVTGTPTVFLADGRRLPGAVPADRLEKELSAVR